MAHELPQIIFMSREYKGNIHDNLRDYLWQFMFLFNVNVHERPANVHK